MCISDASFVSIQVYDSIWDQRELKYLSFLVLLQIKGDLVHF